MNQYPLGYCSAHGDVRLIEGNCALCLERVFPDGIPKRIEEKAASLADVSHRLRHGDKAMACEFIDDWNAMVATVAEFSDKWDLPKPEMVFHPRVHRTMNMVADTRILGTLIHRGVKVRFGHFEQSTVLREES